MVAIRALHSHDYHYGHHKNPNSPCQFGDFTSLSSMPNLSQATTTNPPKHPKQPPVVHPPPHVPKPPPPPFVPQPPANPITPPPQTPCPPPPQTCPTLKLDACVDILGGLVHVGIGSKTKDARCLVLGGLVDLDAALCRCTTIKAKLLNINIIIPIALQLLVECGKSPPSGFHCSA